MAQIRPAMSAGTKPNFVIDDKPDVEINEG